MLTWENDEQVIKSATAAKFDMPALHINLHKKCAIEHCVSSLTCWLVVYML